MELVYLTNKTHRIFKFNINKSKNEEKAHVENWNRAKLNTKFLRILIDNFSGTTLEKIGEKYFINKEEYKKSHIIGTFEIAIDVLKENTGLEKACHWGYDYYAIPIDNVNFLQFFIENKPEHVTEIKRQSFWSEKLTK